MWEITCGECGKTSPIPQWEKSATGGQLPANEFQCPGCQVRIRRVAGKSKVVEVSGRPFIIPGPVTIKTTEAKGAHA